MFDVAESPAARSFFSEIIASISDVKFSGDGRYILSRDYLTVKLWDINMERAPVATFRVHDHLRSKLCDLYESDAIFDKFQCCISGDASHVATGSYGNQFRCFDAGAAAAGATAPGADTLEVTKTPQRLKRARAEARGVASASRGRWAVGRPPCAAVEDESRPSRARVARVLHQNFAHGVASRGGRPRVRGVRCTSSTRDDVGERGPRDVCY